MHIFSFKKIDSVIGNKDLNKLTNNCMYDLVHVLLKCDTSLWFVGHCSFIKNEWQILFKAVKRIKSSKTAMEEKLARAFWLLR